MDNNLVATGGIFGALLAAGLDPTIVTNDGLATNAMTVQLPYMVSRYRLTVDRVPGNPNPQSCDQLWRWVEPTPKEASQVLWTFSAGEWGFRPGSFMLALIGTMCGADPANFARLALGYPGYASAVWAVKNEGDGLARLRVIAAQVADGRGDPPLGAGPEDL